MVSVTKHGIVLRKTDLPFESEGVLNPAVIRDGDDIHMFYRAVAKGNRSSIGYCRFSKPTTPAFRLSQPLIEPEHDYESQGTEDPRIVKIDDTWFLTYTAYDGTNALGALAVSTDLVAFVKKGIIVPQVTYDEFRNLTRGIGDLSVKYSRYNAPKHHFENHGEETFLWDKNVMFFPRRINGNLCFLHRIKPDIQILVEVTDLEQLTPEFWYEYLRKLDTRIVLTPRFAHEVNYIGGGCPPIETADGWLLIYHGVHDTPKGYVYSACAALLDLEHPEIELGRLPYPLFYPEELWELKGEVNNVCFPTGAIVIDGTLYIYYGAADERIALATIELTTLLAELALHPAPDASIHYPP